MEVLIFFILYPVIGAVIAYIYKAYYVCKYNNSRYWEWEYEDYDNLDYYFHKTDDIIILGLWPIVIIYFIGFGIFLGIRFVFRKIFIVPFITIVELIRNRKAFTDANKN